MGRPQRLMLGIDPQGKMEGWNPETENGWDLTGKQFEWQAVWMIFQIPLLFFTLHSSNVSQFSRVFLDFLDGKMVK